MFVAMSLNYVLVAGGAAALADEPPKTVVSQAPMNLRLGDYVTVADGTLNTAALRLVGAASTPIGIDLQPVDLPLKAQLKLDGGAMVARVVPDSEAAKAGIKEYDVVIAVEGKKVPDVVWLTKALEDPGLGKKGAAGDANMFIADVELVREAKPLKVELRRFEKPQVALTTKAYIELKGQDLVGRFVEGEKATDPAEKPYRLGVSLSEPDEVLRSQLKLADGQGLVVTQVLPDGPAAKSGVQKNDVVLTFDKAPTKGVEDLTARIQKTGDKTVVLELVRAGQKLNFEVRPKKDEPVNINTVVDGGNANDVSKIVSDLIILTETDGKRLALTGKPTGEFVTTWARTATLADPARDNQLAAIQSDVKGLRQAVDQLQSQLAQLEKEQVVAKLQANVARLEAALKEAETAKGKK